LKLIPNQVASANLQIQDSSISSVAPFTVSSHKTNNNYLGKSLEYQLYIDSKNRDITTYPDY